jgi:ribose/xylose/arabinose/galactoside ABC-type transport system permease subunit
MIAAMITPALLIMASGSLIATALVRLARVVDRVRKLSEPGAAPPDAGELRQHEHRALLAERAVTLYFLAVVCFVVAGLAIAIDHATGDRLTWLPVLVTTLGMCLIVLGSAAMLAECRLATAQIRREITRSADVVTG